MTTQEVLQQCIVDGLIVRLPDITLDRKQYLEVAKKLELIGGKWKGGKTQGFVFEQDPTELLSDIANGDDRNLKKEFQFFATPDHVADMMVDKLNYEPWMRVLEPSAGDGALIKALKRKFDVGYVDCYEAMELNIKKINPENGNSGIPGALIQGTDFLKCDSKDYYDIILANPPFTKNQDIDHIRKMFEVCKPGGTIVTLSSPSWTFGSQRKQIEFREWLDSLGAEQIEIDLGEFKESGTTIKTVMLIINKPKLCENIDLKQQALPFSYSDPELAEFKTNIDAKLEKANKELEYLKTLLTTDDPENKFEKAQIEQMIVRQETFIDHLNKALERIDNKTYGICRVTGKLIDKARLTAVPHATLSLEAKLAMDKDPPAEPEKKPKQARKKKDAEAAAKAEPSAQARYPDEDLRNFKTIISNKIDEANGELKYLQVVLSDRQKGIKVEDFEDMPPKEVEALIDRKKSYISELESALERVKKKTFGVCEETGDLIPKETLLRLPIIRRLTPSAEHASPTISKTGQEPVRKCRICGCTDDDCSQCIEKTGSPCHWIDVDLCSACEEEAMKESETIVSTEETMEGEPGEGTQLGSRRFYPVGNDLKDLKLLQEYKGHKFYDAGPSEQDGGKNIFIICLSPSEQLHCEYYYPNSEDSLNQTIQRAENWVDDYLAEKQKLITQQNNNEMNFFTQLANAGTGAVDLTMRIMQVNDKLTIEIKPGNSSVSLKPILVTGTPAELDEGFFKTIAPGVKEVAGLVHNIEEVKKDAVTKKAEAEKSKIAKAAQKTTVKKSAKKQKPAVKNEKTKPAAPAPPAETKTDFENNEGSEDAVSEE